MSFGSNIKFVLLLVNRDELSGMLLLYNDPDTLDLIKVPRLPEVGILHEPSVIVHPSGHVFAFGGNVVLWFCLRIISPTPVNTNIKNTVAIPKTIR